MNKFTKTFQDLSQKAAQIKQAIESVPPKIMEVRETARTAVGQLQQLRDGVQASVSSLNVNDHHDLMKSLREIDHNTKVFREAGYEVFDVELELGLINRLVVHLEKFEDVGHESIKVLLMENQSHKTTHAILSALIKAEEMSDGVRLNHLEYHKLTVYVGPTPCVRLCWQSPQEHQSVIQPAPAAAVAPAAPAPSPASSAFAQSSFFEKRAPAPATPATAHDVTAPTPVAAPVMAPVATPAPTPAPAATTTGDWRKDALARFKKMPDLTKR